MIRLVVAFACLVIAAPASAQTPPTAAESHPRLHVEAFAFPAADGTRLRAVVTRPAAPAGRRPAVLFVQWLSCDTVAIPAGKLDGWQTMLQGLVRDSGAVVWRTDKRGVGGSQGDCSALDYETELADHRAALEALKRRPDVDPKRVFVFGASMGSNFAPLLAQGQELAGIIVWGGGARTWAERTLAFERNRLELGDLAPAERAAEILARHRVIDRMLLDGQSPAGEPAWRRLAGTSEDGMYGRSLEWHRQAQRQNWAGAWARTEAPVLALFGEYDWFEDASGVTLIGDIVNARAPGRAQVVIVPGLDHHFQRYASRRAAFAGRGGVVASDAALDVLLPWLRRHAGL